MTGRSLIAHARKSAAPMPYASLPDTSIAILERALRISWEQACADQGHFGVNFLACKEEEISAVLTDVMGILAADTVNQPLGTFNEFFHMAIAEGSLLMKATERVVKPGGLPVSGLKSKRPDYAIWPKVLPGGHQQLYYAIFVEAKILDARRSMHWYCTTGLWRFVDGQYAWSMSQAVMLAYLCNTSQQLPKTLSKHLDKRRVQYGVETMPSACTFSRKDMRMHETNHKRDRVYRDSGAALGPIRLFHLWMDVPG